MNTDKSETRKLCGAKTRAGTPCRRAAMPNGRCSNHGGKSPMWFGHPNYKHGRYSKYSMVSVFEKAEKMRKKRDAAFLRAWAKMEEKLGRELTYEEARQLLYSFQRNSSKKKKGG